MGSIWKERAGMAWLLFMLPCVMLFENLLYLYLVGYKFEI